MESEPGWSREESQERTSDGQDLSSPPLRQRRSQRSRAQVSSSNSIVPVVPQTVPESERSASVSADGATVNNPLFADDVEVIHAFEMLRIDFAKRSDQVVQLALDRSRFLRLTILLWSGPLIITYFLLREAPLASQLSPSLSSKAVAGMAFILSALANCAILAAMTGNRNTSNIATAGMNYLRMTYLHMLVRKNMITIDESLRNVLSIDERATPVFRAVTSSSSDLVLYVTAFINVVYGLIGVSIVYISSDSLSFLASVILEVIVVSVHFIMLRRISIRSLVTQGERI
jgi:hypothetical protein